MVVKKQYSDEFKRDAIRLLETSGKRLSEIEKELGLPHGLCSQPISWTLSHLLG